MLCVVDSCSVYRPSGSIGDQRSVFLECRNNTCPYISYSRIEELSSLCKRPDFCWLSNREVKATAASPVSRCAGTQLPTSTSKNWICLCISRGLSPNFVPRLPSACVSLVMLCDPHLGGYSVGLIHSSIAIEPKSLFRDISCFHANEFQEATSISPLLLLCLLQPLSPSLPSLFFSFPFFLLSPSFFFFFLSF